MLLSERQNGLKSRAFGDLGFSGGSFFMLDCCCHRSNSKIESDNSNGENDNTHREKRQQQRKKRQHPLTTATGKIKM